MAQAVSYQPLIMEAWVQFQAKPCGSFGGQSGKWDRFVSKYFGFPAINLPLMLLTHSFNCRYVTLAINTIMKYTQTGVLT
jgi:hypothetical protein